MGRPFDQLDLSGLPPDRGADEEAADLLCTVIEWMRSSGTFDWADETLVGIYDRVRERKLCTFAQQTAVRNIWYARLPDVEFGDLS